MAVEIAAQEHAVEAHPCGDILLAMLARFVGDECFGVGARVFAGGNIKAKSVGEVRIVAGGFTDGGQMDVPDGRRRIKDSAVPIAIVLAVPGSVDVQLAENWSVAKFLYPVVDVELDIVIVVRKVQTLSDHGISIPLFIGHGAGVMSCYGRNLYIIAQNVYAVQGFACGLSGVCLGFVVSATVLFAACSKSINFFYFSHM